MEDATSVKKLFLKENEVSGGISEDFYILDCWDCFVGIKVDVLVKWQFSVNDKPEIFPDILVLQDRATDI